MRVMLKSKIRLLFNQDTTELKQDASIVKLNISELHQAVIPRRLCPWKHSKVSTNSLIIRYVTQIYSLHNSIDVKIVKTVVHYSCFLGYYSAKNIDIMSTEGLFLPSKRQVFYSTHCVNNTVRMSEIHVIWESVHWARKKCPLSAITGVSIKGVEFRENAGCMDFPQGQSKLSVITRCPY